MRIETVASKRLERLRSLRYPVSRSLFQLRLHFARRPTWSAWTLARRVRRAVEPACELELISVAFNNELVIRLQHQMLRQHILDRYHWTVVDNSPSRQCRKALRSFCGANQIPYLRLPRNPWTGHEPSHSHAEALNYIVRRYAGASGAPILGLLDHDIFPTAPSSPVARIGGAVVYGREQVKQGTRYLWPGLLFLRRDRVDLQFLDFRPCVGGDTGAQLASLYSRLAEHEIVLTSQDAFPNWTADDRYEVFDEWLHTVNASYWKAVAPKEADIVRLLQKHAGLG